MTSERKAAANRRNGRKGRGPRSAAGKSVASRNALRHGFAALTHRHPAAKEDIEQVAEALCGDDPNPSLIEQARIIANNDLVLRAIGAQQLAVVERVREPTAIAFAKGPNDLRLADQRFRKAKLADKALVALRDRLLEQYKDELPAAIGRDDEDEAFGPAVVVSRLLSFLQDRRMRKVCRRVIRANLPRIRSSSAMKAPHSRRRPSISSASIVMNVAPGLGKNARSALS